MDNRTDNMGFTNDELNDLLQHDFAFPAIFNMQDDLRTMFPTVQQTATPGSTVSNVNTAVQDQFVELGSSYGSDQLTLNNHTTNMNPTSNVPVAENFSGSLPHQDNYFVAMLQSDYHPTEYFEMGSPSWGGIVLPQFNQASDLNISTVPAVGESSESPAAAAFNHQNLFDEESMIAFDSLFPDSPAPYRPVMDFCDQQPGRNGQNAGQDILVSDYVPSENLGVSAAVNHQNIWQTGSASFNMPLPTAPQTYSSPIAFEHNQAVADLIPQPGAAPQSFYPQQEVNLVRPSTQPNTYPDNTPSNMLQSTQSMGTLNQGTPTFLAQPVGQNLAANNYYSSNINQQMSSQYQTSSFQPFSKNFCNEQAGLQVGNVNERQSSIPYQQQAVWQSTGPSIAYNMPSSQLGPHKLSRAQIGEGLMTNSQNSGSVRPKNSVSSSRPRELTVQKKPELEMSPNIPNPQDYSRHFMSSARARSSRPLPDQHDQRYTQAAPPTRAPPTSAIAAILARTPRTSDYPHTFYHSTRASWTDYLRPVTLAPKSFVLGGISRPSSPSLKRNRDSFSKSNESSPQEQSKQRNPSERDRQQKEKENNRQHYPAMLSPTAPGTPSRPSNFPTIPIVARALRVNGNQQPDRSPFAHDATGFQRGKSVLEPSRRQDMGKFQGSLDPNSGSSPSNFTGSTNPLTPQSNPKTHQQEIGDHEFQSRMTKPFDGTPSVGNEKGKQKAHGDPSSPFPLGESLYASTGNKVKFPMFPPVTISEQLLRDFARAQEKIAQNNANVFGPPAREHKNSAYDEKFEAMGIPIDPHLRLFAKNNVIPDGNKQLKLNKS